MKRNRDKQENKLQHNGFRHPRKDIPKEIPKETVIETHIIYLPYYVPVEMPAQESKEKDRNESQNEINILDASLGFAFLVLLLVATYLIVKKYLYNGN